MYLLCSQWLSVLALFPPTPGPPSRLWVTFRYKHSGRLGCGGAGGRAGWVGCIWGCGVCAPTLVKRGCRGHHRFLLCASQERGKKNVRRNVQCRTVAFLLFTAVSPPRCPQCAVQVKLELGHRAQVRKKPTVEGFTHDWMVFVRGPEHSNIQHFVEKVVFHLHESFPRPKRGRARIQKELDKKCLCSRRKQSLGPGGPPSPLPAPRVALAGVALDPRPRRRFGSVKVTAEKGPSGVECLFIPSQPSPALWG